MHSTNYINTFITVAADCPAAEGVTPGKAGSVGDLQLRLIRDNPYGMTSDDILFAVHAIRNAIPEADQPGERAAFFGKPMACLRASPLVKSFGWGLHHDGEGRVAAYGIGSADYRRLAEAGDVKTVSGMRNKRA